MGESVDEILFRTDRLIEFTTVDGGDKMGGVEESQKK